MNDDGDVGVVKVNEEGDRGTKSGEYWEEFGNDNGLKFLLLMLFILEVIVVEANEDKRSVAGFDVLSVSNMLKKIGNKSLKLLKM